MNCVSAHGRASAIPLRNPMPPKSRSPMNTTKPPLVHSNRPRRPPRRRGFRMSFDVSVSDLYKFISIAIYAVVLIVIGVLASRRMKDLRDYYAGGKSLGFWSVAFSSRATGESAWLLIGLTGFGATYGLKGLWIVLGELLGVGIAWLFMAKRFKKLTDRYDSVTVPDYLESRFRDSGQWLRLIAAGALVIFVPIYVSAQIHASGQAFHDFLGMNYYIGALLGFAVVLAYITQGGFIAVVWSDVFQGLLMVAGLVSLPIVGIAAMGGPSGVLDSLEASYPGLLTLHGGEGWTTRNIISIIGACAIGLGFLGSPQVFVRFISLRSETEISKGAAVALIWTLLADGGAVCVGLVGRALLTGDIGSNGEAVLPLMVDDLMHPLLAGVYIAIVLAATMSTIDSLLVVASSAAARDYYQKHKHPELSDASLLSLSRKLTVVLAFVSLAIAMGVALVNHQQGVFWYIIFGWSGIAATFCPVIILSLYWSR
ncbi:MAG TPA: sodium/proline symporter, partial [Phycisphaerales bacterium]|nr:sodium/proline symporter [Phycisphaerales bacterium]